MNKKTMKRKKEYVKYTSYWIKWRLITNKDRYVKIYNRTEEQVKRFNAANKYEKYIEYDKSVVMEAVRDILDERYTNED